MSSAKRALAAACASGAPFGTIAFTAALVKCMSTGVTTGGNPAAAKQAEQDVRVFVTRAMS